MAILIEIHLILVALEDGQVSIPTCCWLMGQIQEPIQSWIVCHVLSSLTLFVSRCHHCHSGHSFDYRMPHIPPNIGSIDMFFFLFSFSYNCFSCPFVWSINNLHISCRYALILWLSTQKQQVTLIWFCNLWDFFSYHILDFLILNFIWFEIYIALISYVIQTSISC